MVPAQEYPQIVEVSDDEQESCYTQPPGSDGVIKNLTTDNIHGTMFGEQSGKIQQSVTNSTSALPMAGVITPNPKDAPLSQPTAVASPQVHTTGTEDLMRRLTVTPQPTSSKTQQLPPNSQATNDFRSRLPSVIDLEDSSKRQAVSNSGYSNGPIVYESDPDDAVYAQELEDEAELLELECITISDSEGPDESELQARISTVKYPKRNATPELPWVEVSSSPFGGRTLRAGKTVELVDGDFLRVTAILEDVEQVDQFRLRGWRFRRTSNMRGCLLKARNEVCAIMKVDQDDPRGPFEQGVEELPITEATRIRRLFMTNRDIPALSFREHSNRRGCTAQEINDEFQLVCRWKRIKYYETAADRLKKVDPEVVISKVREDEVDLAAKIPAAARMRDADLRILWRGETVRGGAGATVRPRQCPRSSKVASLGAGTQAASSKSTSTRSPPSTRSYKTAVHSRTHIYAATNKLTLSSVDLTSPDPESPLTPGRPPAFSLPKAPSPTMAALRQCPLHQGRMLQAHTTMIDLLDGNTDSESDDTVELVRLRTSGAQKRILKFTTSQGQSHPEGRHKRKLSETRSELTASVNTGPNGRHHRIRITGTLTASWDLHQSPRPIEPKVSESLMPMYSGRSTRSRSDWLQTPNAETERGNRVARSDGSTDTIIPCYWYGDGFCGAGGMSCGAKQAGLRVVYGFDRNQHAIATYRMNYHDAIAYHASAEDFMSLTDNESIDEGFKVDILHMSPPCQYFSPAHTVAGRDDEENQAAIFAIDTLLKKALPRIATLEETPGLKSRFRDFFNRVLQMFTEHGYSVRYKVVNFADYGLPQARKRLMIVAAW